MRLKYSIGMTVFDPSVHAWAVEAGVGRPTVLGPGIGLTPLQDGTARLTWVFDDDPEPQGMDVHLTDAEAQRVYETPSSEGLLEQVRATMTYPDVLLWGPGFAEIFTVSGIVDENQLWGNIWGALPQSPARTSTSRGEMNVTLHEANDASAALAALRDEIESLAGAAAAVSVQAQPLRVEVGGRSPNEYTTEFWYEDSTFKVISCDGSVGIAGGRGRELDWWPDFTVVGTEQIRGIVAGLLSAHQWVLEHPARQHPRPE